MSLASSSGGGGKEERRKKMAKKALAQGRGEDTDTEDDSDGDDGEEEEVAYIEALGGGDKAISLLADVDWVGIAQEDDSAPSGSAETSRVAPPTPSEQRAEECAAGAPQPSTGMGRVVSPKPPALQRGLKRPRVAETSLGMTG
jgi:hypothetical protein